MRFKIQALLRSEPPVVLNRGTTGKERRRQSLFGRRAEYLNASDLAAITDPNEPSALVFEMRVAGDPYDVEPDDVASRDVAGAAQQHILHLLVDVEVGRIDDDDCRTRRA